jgi:hypothetical protein
MRRGAILGIYVTPKLSVLIGRHVEAHQLDPENHPSSRLRRAGGKLSQSDKSYFAQPTTTPDEAGRFVSIEGP